MLFRTIRVNLTEGKITEEVFDQLQHGYHGGRGLVADFMTAEVDPKCDPLGPDNKMIFCTGYFSGTNVPASNRLSVGGKSPLTGLIKESNSGGTVARRMTDHKIKQIIIEGMSDKWVYLYIDKQGQPHLLDAVEFVGHNTYDVCAIAQKKYDDRVAVATIGQAGEHGGLISSIMCSEMLTGFACRAAARGGMGAVMGGKKLKCIIIEHSDDPFIYKCPTEEMEAEFQECNAKCVAAIFQNPLTGQTMPLYGSAAGVDTTGAMGALPWNNFNGKFTPGWERLGTIEWRKHILDQGGHSTIACQPSCTVRCSAEYCDKNGKYLSAGIEYETVALCGSNIGVFDTDVVVTIDRMCDEYGMDTIDTGCGIGVMMEQGVLQFGDAEGAINLLKNLFNPDNEYGKVLINGCAAVADYLGVPEQAIKKVPVSKRQAFAAYDPRVIRGYGLSWERGPMGADHTQGSASTFLMQLTPEQQTDTALSATCTCDCFMCLFPWAAVNFNPQARPAIMRMAALLSGKAEENPGAQGVEMNGMPILMAEYAWNEKAGWTHDMDEFYGGKGNYMYNVGHEAAMGATFRSVQDGPLPPPPAPPAPPAEKKEEAPKPEDKKEESK